MSDHTIGDPGVPPSIGHTQKRSRVRWAALRTFHANGDGTFVVDGQTLNLEERMVKWVSHTVD